MNTRVRPRLHVLMVIACLLVAGGMPLAQTLTGTLEGTVKDAQGGVLPGASVRLTSPALTGGAATLVTNGQGDFRFLALPPGAYVLEIGLRGFSTLRDDAVRIGAGATLRRTVVLMVAGSESVVVEGRASRMDTHDPGFATRFGEEIRTIPTRRSSMFDFLRATPWISPTSPSSGTTTTISAAGSGINENQFLLDGQNTTCPCNGVARAEPGPDFIQEVQVQTAGASAEFGNVQGAIVNVITRHGSDRLLFDSSYYSQVSWLTSASAVLQSAVAPEVGLTGYSRAHYRDATANLGGPMMASRAWFFLGYQHFRDVDSQPGTDPAHPREIRQDKIFLKLNWRLAPGWQLDQGVHYERGSTPDRPTYVTPIEAISRPSVSVPAITFGHLTHATSGQSVFEVRVGRFVYKRDEEPSTGDWTAQSRINRLTSVASGAPPVLTRLTLRRTTGTATMTRYQSGLFGMDQLWKVGVQIEQGEHQSPAVIPTGVRFVDSGGSPFQMISSAPSNTGGRFITAGVFLTDVIKVGSRLTINAGLRFDHSRATSQDLHAVDSQGHENGDVIPGRGTLFTWNTVSPRLGLVVALDAAGRTMVRASGGRYTQGVQTGEIGSFSPGATSITTATFDPATAGYTRISVFDPRKNLEFDSGIRSPHTDEYSIGLDREIGRQLTLSVAYVRKRGRDFIGWTETAGKYLVQDQPALPDGRVIQASVLTTPASARVFQLTNPKGYELQYDGLAVVAEKPRQHGWQAFGSYTWSRASGLLASSGAIAAGAQVSTVAPPPAPQGITFGRDPNDLTNTRGLLPNDRPHIFRVMTSMDVPRTGLVIAANLQYFSGKPWAATTQVNLSRTGQGDVRVFLEPRGTRRLSPQTLLDLRLSRTIAVGRLGQVDLLLDVLNVLNNRAEEGLATDNYYSPNFGVPTVFIDPRRAMLGIRMNVGR